MAHIFISYARSSEREAKHIEEALSRAGYEIWRDNQLPAHRSYADVIEERLTEAAAVLVLWSADAARSHWVRAEADRALSAGTLVQVTLDGSLPPMPFNQMQCGPLDPWDQNAPEWAKLQTSVAELVGRESTARASSQEHISKRHLSVCVLPFQNMSADPEQEYFSDGITEDIITDLSKVSAISVVARNTSFTFKGKAVDVSAVARQLNVSHVLEGSVRRFGARVRITAQLIDGSRGDHVWADRWDRTLDDIFSLQDEISEAIVSALCVKLLPNERQAIETRSTHVPEAYDFYLLARQQWISGNEGDRSRDDRILRICKEAVALDPSYAEAWALMALVQAELRFRHGDTEDSGIDAADRALAINPDLADAHAVRARYLAEQGRQEESAAEIATALRLDPHSWVVNREAGTLAFRDRRISEAVPFFEKAAVLQEADYYDPGFLVVCYTAMGKLEDARRAARITVERAERVVEQDSGNSAALAHGAYSLACIGENQRAREWASRALLVDPDNLITRYRLACLFANLLADLNGAMDLLQPYFAQCSSSRVSYAENDPDLEPLREQPRFLENVKEARIRLCEGAK